VNYKDKKINDSNPLIVTSPESSQQIRTANLPTKKIQQENTRAEVNSIGHQLDQT